MGQCLKTSSSIRVSISVSIELTKPAASGLIITSLNVGLSSLFASVINNAGLRYSSCHMKDSVDVLHDKVLLQGQPEQH